MDRLNAPQAPQDVLVFTATGAGGATYSKTGVNSAGNYAEIKEQFGIPHVVTAHQIHSSDIIKVRPETGSLVDGTDGDGLFTASCNLALGILTADCYPVMIAGKSSVAALHCGWRGTAAGIIEKSLLFFEKESDAPLYAYVGPGISKDAFEVKEDFIQAVSVKVDASKYLSKKDNGWRFDLHALILNKLADIGVENIETSGGCTFSNNRFHSYRRDGAKSGRMLTVIFRRAV